MRTVKENDSLGLFCGACTLVINVKKSIDPSSIATNVLNIMGVSEGNQNDKIGQISTDANGNRILIEFVEPLPDDKYTLTLSETVLDQEGNTLIGNTDIQLSVLTGNVNADTIVNVGDMIGVRAHIGMPIDEETVKYDINQDGNINVGDLISIRARSGNTLP